MAKIKLGQVLVDEGIITEEQLQEVLAEQKISNKRLGDLLIEKKLLDESVLLNCLSTQLDIPWVDLTQYKLDYDLTKKIPEAYARRYRAVLLSEEDDAYLVAMKDPLDIIAVDEFGRILDKPIKLAVVSEKQLSKALDLIYRRTEEITSFAEELDEEITSTVTAILEAEPGEVDAPVVKLLLSVFEDAVQVGASDIHIEPDDKVLRIRLRVDGILHEQIIKEKDIALAIASRLKLMAKLNIAEKRLPQDGRFTIKVRDKIIDVRLSTLPTPKGESIVMRLLDQSTSILDLEKIGMSKPLLKRLRQLAAQPHGIVLVTGPTGSGKTTTLYGVLSELNQEGKKIITAEDPIEYRMSRIIQVQVNEKLKLTFSSVLRAAMRQDPDIILVGEMRDTETANIAIRAALTGHLVLSTLHTNDAASSAFRLVDMGVEGFMVASTLRGVLAQRLARKICDSCATSYELSDIEKGWLEAAGYDEYAKDEFTAGKGCNYCNKTGYRGRTGVFELLELNADMISALRQNRPDEFADHAENSLVGSFLIDNAIALAKEGVTTIEEAMRLTGEV